MLPLAVTLMAATVTTIIIRILPSSTFCCYCPQYYMQFMGPFLVFVFSFVFQYGRSLAENTKAPLVLEVEWLILASSLLKNTKAPLVLEVEWLVLSDEPKLTLV